MATFTFLPFPPFLPVPPRVMQLIDRILRTIRTHDLAGADTRVVVALSGGSDSVALAYLLAELSLRGLVRVVGAAHLNHQLRAAADADEAFCAGVAARLGWAFHSGRTDVAARARDEWRSIEDAGHTARHEFFEAVRQRVGADVVALGHTRDDQAETFLLRLIRGAGPRGLGGMYPKRGRIIRPLIDCRRHELREHLDQLGVAFVHDESNDDVDIPRNRVRRELLPLLEQRFNPSIVDVLAGEADLARDEWAWIEDAVKQATGAVVRREAEHVWSLDAEALGRMPRALARPIVRQALLDASGGAAVAFSHVEAALRVAEGREGPVDGPGARLERVGDRLVLTKGTAGHERPVNLFSLPLSIPGEVAGKGGWVVTAETAASVAAVSAGVSSSATGVLRLDRCRPPLKVRNRRPGDRFRPLGLGGRKKLQDYFVDKKVPRDRRDLVPLVVDENDRILWVGGYAIDDDFRVTDPAQAVLILRLRQL